jgi:uncharacterized SAM-binding protein YcdF (DUF218 family)
MGGFLAWFLRAAAVAGLLWSGGFLWFVGHLPESGGRPADADAIVVLTGTSERLQAGFELLREGRAKRMFITGVAQGTHPRHLAPVLGVDPALAGCCVELGREARDTVGNAIETAAWAARHGYDSLVLVTSVYHGPRSLIVFRQAMPRLSIAAHLVVDTREPLGAWWRNFALARVLAGEYTKYAVALLRARLSGLDR